MRSRGSLMESTDRCQASPDAGVAHCAQHHGPASRPSTARGHGARSQVGLTDGRHPIKHRHIGTVGTGSVPAANPYTHGGCTFWAWANRSDLPRNLGNARYRAVNAAKAGFPVDNTPEVGAIAVYQPGVDGGVAPDGHVAVVQQVAGARIYISEASFDRRFPDYGDHEIYHRWTGIQGVQFIHRIPTPVVVVPKVDPPVVTVPNQDPPKSQPPNLLANPGFETEPGAPGWFRNNLTTSVNEQVYNIPARAHSGSWFFETNTSRQGGSIAQDLAISPGAGDDYQFSIWLRSPSGAPFSICPTIWALGTAGNTPARPASRSAARGSRSRPGS